MVPDYMNIKDPSLAEYNRTLSNVVSKLAILINGHHRIAPMHGYNDPQPQGPIQGILPTLSNLSTLPNYSAGHWPTTSQNIVTYL